MLKKKGRASSLSVQLEIAQPQLAHVDTLLGQKEGGGACWKEGRPFFSQCVCVCLLSYKLPTPLPLLLQCRGGRRLSQVVFTQLGKKIRNSLTRRQFVHPYALWVSVCLLIGRRINNHLWTRRKFVNFSPVLFVSPGTFRRNIFTCEHVFTSHWILNVWLVFLFWFDSPTHFLMGGEEKSNGKIVTVRVPAPSGNGDFCRYFFSFLNNLKKKNHLWGREREKK